MEEQSAMRYRTVTSSLLASLTVILSLLSQLFGLDVDALKLLIHAKFLREEPFSYHCDLKKRRSIVKQRQINQCTKNKNIIS